MANIQIPSNCGNAPKQQVIVDFIVALAKEKWNEAYVMLADDVSLEIVGKQSAKGLAAVKEVIATDAERSQLTALQIEQVISHGKICTARGRQSFGDGGEVAFSSWYMFSSHGKNAKIQSIQMYFVICT